MTNGKAQPATVTRSWVRLHWAAAIVAAILLIFVENWVVSRTLWHRVASLEDRVQRIETELHAH